MGIKKSSGIPLSAFIELAPLFLFPAVASLIGLVRSWRGVLNRDDYLSWGWVWRSGFQFW